MAPTKDEETGREEVQSNQLPKTMYEMKFDVAPQEMDIRGSFVFAADFTNTVVNRFYVDNSIFIGCSFEDCTLEDVTISNCVFVGARFVKCKFSDVIWQNVRKVDAIATRKDLTNHSEVLGRTPKEISDPQWLPTLLSLNDPLTDWKFASERKKSPDSEPAESTEAASPSPSESHEKAPDSSSASSPPESPDAAQDDYVMPEAETVSQDAGTGPPPLATPKPFATMTRAACEKWFKEKNRWGSKMSNQARSIVRRSRGKAFPYMYLPAHLRMRVYNTLLRSSDIVIVDRPQAFRGPPAPTGQLQYKMWNHFCRKERAWSTTYLITSSDGPENSTMIETAILRTSKRVYNEAISRLYDRKIVFNCSAEGALSWMHDISVNLSKITTLVFTYRLRDSTEVGPYESRIEHPRTRDRAFRYLVNTIVHKCDSLHYFGFRIDKSFWSATRWNKSISELLEHESNSYLLEVARLAHYDDQAAQHEPRNNGVWLQFFIEKAEHNWQKSKFKDELERAIQLKRADRPRIAYSRPCNGCKATTYDECCFVKLPVGERTGG